MITVPEVVENIIQTKPFIQEALIEDLINISSLARSIRAEVEEKTMKEVQEGSIIMALKRLTQKYKKTGVISPILTIEGNVDLIVRSNLIELTYNNSPTLQQKQKEILDKFGNNNTHFVVVTHGVFETTFLVSEELRSHMDTLFKGEEQVAFIPDLSSLTVRFKKVIVEDIGCYYLILKLLAWDGLNIIEAASTYNEITLFMRDKDIDRAFSLLKQKLT